jgi:hypothetical protein
MAAGLLQAGPAEARDSSASDAYYKAYLKREESRRQYSSQLLKMSNPTPAQIQGLKEKILIPADQEFKKAEQSFGQSANGRANFDFLKKVPSYVGAGSRGTSRKVASSDSENAKPNAPAPIPKPGSIEAGAYRRASGSGGAAAKKTETDSTTDTSVEVDPGDRPNYVEFPGKK